MRKILFVTALVSLFSVNAFAITLYDALNETYENNKIIDDKDRWLHFGQNNHVRFYGKDFRDRISKGGFNLISEITAVGEDVVKYSLTRGEKVFVFQKSF